MQKLAELIGESQIAMLATAERLHGFAKAIATGDTKALGEHEKVRGPGH